jgi:hypothetical protein
MFVSWYEDYHVEIKEFATLNDLLIVVCCESSTKRRDTSNRAQSLCLVLSILQCTLSTLKQGEKRRREKEEGSK